MKNKKGMSIIELIVSVALISVVMVFMYRLLADIKYETSNDAFASKNQNQRVEIIKTLEEYLDSIEIHEFSIYGNDISFNSFESFIRVTNDQIILHKNDDELKWKIKEGYLGELSVSSGTTLSNNRILYLCKIPVYTNNTNNQIIENNFSFNNNNTIDDIEFSFIKIST